MAYTQQQLDEAANQVLAPEKVVPLVDYAVQHNPDEYAKNLAKARETGLLPSEVPAAQEDIRRNDLGRAYADLAESAPKTFAWASAHPDNATIMQDALEHSKRLEQAANQNLASRKEAGARFAQVGENLGGVVKAAVYGLGGFGQQVAQFVTATAIQPFTKALAGTILPEDFGSAMVEHFKAGREKFKGAQEKARPTTENFFEKAAYSGLESAAQVGLLLPLTSAKYLVDAFGAVQGMESFWQAQDKGQGVFKSAIYGTAQGYIERQTELLGMTALIHGMTGKTGLLEASKEFAKKEIWGEQQATFFQRLNEWTFLNPEVPFSEYLKTIPEAQAATLVATLVGAGAQIGGMHVLRGVVSALPMREPQQLGLERMRKQLDANRAAEAESSARVLTEIVAVANEHPLRERAPAAFKEWASKVLEDTTLTEVYVDAVKFNEALDQQGITIAEVRRTMPEVADQLSEGRQLGHDVRIPVADFLTHVTNPVVQEAILPSLKTSPEGFTYAQSQAYFQEETKRLGEEATKLAEEVAPVLSREEFERRGPGPGFPILMNEFQGLKMRQYADDFNIQAESAFGGAPYTVAPTVQEVPLDQVSLQGEKLYETPEEQARVAALAEEIKASGEIEPLLVAQKADGTRYVAEGNHRARALQALGHTSVPAIVVTEGAAQPAPKQSYEQYLREHKNKAETRRREAAAVRGEIMDAMREMKAFPESVISAYSIPFTEFYVTNAARLGISVTELNQQIPIRFAANQLLQGYMQPTRAAGVEDFTQYTVSNILKKDGWAILTAWNPGGKESLRAENIERGRKLGQELTTAGIKHLPVRGQYTGQAEEAFVLLGVSREEAFRFAKAHGQEAVLTRDGLLFADGSYARSTGVVTYPERPTDDYTQLPDGGFFRVDLEKDAHGDLLRRDMAELPEDPAAKVFTYPQQGAPAGEYEDVRVFWEAYIRGNPFVEQYGRTEARAEEGSVEGYRKALLQAFSEVMLAPSGITVKDVSSVWSGGANLPYGGYAYSVDSGPQRALVFIDPESRDLQVNVAQWGAGKGGSQVYKALLDFARANNMVFYGDAAGVTLAGKKRRLENLLSHALLTGETKHMRLHPSQLEFIKKETGEEVIWTDDAKNNIEQMLKTSYNLVSKQNPEIENVQYDFTRRSFIDTRTGEPVADFSRLLSPSAGGFDAVRGEGQAGITTLKRAIISNTFLHTRSPEARRDVLAALAALAVERLPGAERVLYQPHRVKTAAEGALTITGHHFSTQRREVLDGRFYGTGARGAERSRVGESQDSRIKERLHFYVDEGKGVFPEAGVGNYEHVVQLTNLYDATRNPLGMRAADSNAWESAVLDAGFSGYYHEGAFGRQGAAVLLGEASRAVLREEYGQAMPQTETPAFKSWFGDSKVVDAEGKPLVMYHATKEDFSVFKTGKGGYSGHAIWLSPHKEFQPVAHSIGRSIGEMHSYVTGAKVMKLFAKIEHPLLLDSLDMVKWAQNTFAGGSQNFPQLISDEIVAELRDAGYDGIIFKGTELKGWGKYADEYIVFEPTQIKSATGNRGTFDPTSPNILYQGGTFYSALTRAVETHKQAKGSPDQWAAIIKNLTQKGVKKAEIDYTGVLDWLEVRKAMPASWQLVRFDGEVYSSRPATDPKPEAPEGGTVRLYSRADSVTREEILQYLNSRKLTITPVAKSGVFVENIEIPSPDWELDTDQAEEEIQAWADERMSDEEVVSDVREYLANQRGVEPDEVSAEGVEEEVYRREEGAFYDDPPSWMYYARLSVMVGEEEVDFSLYDSEGPQIHDITNGREVLRNRGQDVEDAIREYLAESYALGEGTKWGEYTLPNATEYEEHLLLNESHTGTPFYNTTHYDEKNITAFIRRSIREVPLSALEETHGEMVARLRAKGFARAKVYFIEEMQSDWAQQGREKVTKQVTRPIRLDEIELDEAATRESEESARSAGYFVQEVYEGEWAVGRVASGEIISFHPSKEEATEQMLRRGGAVWVFRIAEGVVTRGERSLAQSRGRPLGMARQIIANVVDVVVGERTMTRFEAAKARDELLDKTQELRKRKRELLKSLPDEEVFADTQFSEEEKRVRDEISTIGDEIEAIGEELATIPESKIEPAALVTTTDAWVSLAYKYAIRDAVENGADMVAWTTGEQQTARWRNGLRERVDTIRWEKTPDGVHIVALKNEKEAVNTKVLEDKLSDTIGDAMAEQIINDPAPAGEIAGEGITVTTPGMHSTYGDPHGLALSGKPAIYPKVAGQVLKALGGGEVKPMYVVQQKRAVSPRVYVGGEILYEKVPVESDTEFSAQPSFEVTPKMKELALAGQPLWQPQHLAAFDPSSLTISMLKGANLSSMLHESGHFYLEALSAMAAMPNAPQQIKDDWAKTLKWFGVSDTATWDALAFEDKRQHHEQWSQSMERWFLEGQAPTLEMQPIFARFRAWMMRVYESVEKFLAQNPLAGKLNDEVRGVFGRLMASEEAIAHAEKTRRYASLFPRAEAASMTEEQFTEYLALGELATQDSITEMQQRSLKDMAWTSRARHKAIRTSQREAATKRKAIEAEVTKEVMAEPLNQARTFLTKGEVFDETSQEHVKAPGGYKLSTEALREMYPETALSRPDTTKLAGMTTRTEGLHPDLVAQMFGFSSGDALVRELIAGEKAADKIAGLTDQRMLEEHGELIDAEAIERAAEAAVHNEARSRFLATGLQILTKSPISAKDLNAAAKQAAEATIARKKIRDVKPTQYAAAEGRANKKALAEAAREPAKAVEAQRAALLNNRLSRAASDALEEVDSFLRLAAKFDSEGVRKNLDIEYLEQIDDLLSPLDLRKGQTLKAVDKRRSLAEWVSRQEALGFEPILDAALVEGLKTKHYKDLTVEELRGLVDAVKQIEHLGRLKKKLLTAKDAREFAARVEEAAASLEANANRVVTESATPSDAVGRVSQWARGMAASHRKFSSIIREMDGGQDGGVMWELLSRGMNEAGDTETSMKAEAAKSLAEIFRPILPEIKSLRNVVLAKRFLIPGTTISMTNEERLVFALNWGNEGNRQRLLDGGLSGKRSLSMAEAESVLDTLTKKEWDFVQNTWDYIGGFREQIVAQERRLVGKEPKWIEPTPIVTKFGTYQGGYFPAKYDAELSTRSESLEAATNLRMAMKGAFNSAATRNGYTQKRAEEVTGRPLLLSFNAISQHVNEVIHRLSWQDWLTDANRVLRSLDGTMREHYGAEIVREMRDTVRDIAQGDAPATTPVEVAANRVRLGSTIVGMGWKFTTAMLQPSGLAQSWVRVGGPWVARGLKQYLAHPVDTVKSVEERSAFMRDRGRTMYREINEVLNTVRAGEELSAVKASYFVMIAKMQRTVDMPTWLGAYEKAVAQLGLERATNEKQRKEIEDKAVALADQAVLDSQSGGQLKDLAKVQRGSPLFKLFTNFYSYFSATYNLNVEAYRRTSFKSPSQIGLLAVDLLILNTVPVLFAVALKELLKGGCEDDDLECLAGRLAHEQLGFLFGQMILLREVGTAVDVATGGSVFGYSGPAGLRFFGDLYKLGQQTAQGKADLALFKAANQVGGALLHYPAGQVNTTVEGIIEIEKGNVEGVGIVPALIAGKPRKEN